MKNTVARVRYLGNHTSNLFQQSQLNDSIPSYVWYMTRHAVADRHHVWIARRLYDSTSGYGALTSYKLTGWNNNNGLELEMERRFARGIGLPHLLRSAERVRLDELQFRLHDRHRCLSRSGLLPAGDSPDRLRRAQPVS